MRILALLAGVALAAFVAYVVCWQLWPPRVWLQGKRLADGSVVLTATRNFRTNCILGITVYDEHRKLWSISRSDGQPKSLTVKYGVVQESMRQLVPEHNAPPLELEAGSDLYVEIRYQYDYGIAPCAGEQAFR